MKKLTVFMVSAVLLLSGAVLFAGELRIGGEVGGNYTIFSDTTQKGRATENGTFYFDVLVPVEYRFNERLSLATGLQWKADATRFKREFKYTDFATGIFVNYTVDDYTRVRHYLEIPLTARFYLENDPVSVFIGAGGYVGLYLGSWQYGKTEAAVSGELVDVFAASGPESGDSLFTAGLTAELGAGFGLGPGELYLAARYSYGLTNLSKAQTQSTAIRYSNVTLNAGYTVAIGGAK